MDDPGSPGKNGLRATPDLVRGSGRRTRPCEYEIAGKTDRRESRRRSGKRPGVDPKPDNPAPRLKVARHRRPAVRFRRKAPRRARAWPGPRPRVFSEKNDGATPTKLDSIRFGVWIAHHWPGSDKNQVPSQNHCHRSHRIHCHEPSR